jgi:hypothetical protein
MSTSRLPRVDLSQLLQDQHPHIDLRLNIYEESTQNFLKALVGFKNNAIASISERRKYQTAEKKKSTEKSQHIETEINHCKLKEIDLVAGEPLGVISRLIIQLVFSQNSNVKRKNGRMQSCRWPPFSDNSPH